MKWNLSKSNGKVQVWLEITHFTLASSWRLQQLKLQVQPLTKSDRETEVPLQWHLPCHHGSVARDSSRTSVFLARIKSSSFVSSCYIVVQSAASAPRSTTTTTKQLRRV